MLTVPRSNINYCENENVSVGNAYANIATVSIMDTEQERNISHKRIGLTDMQRKPRNSSDLSVIPVKKRAKIMLKECTSFSANFNGVKAM